MTIKIPQNTKTFSVPQSSSVLGNLFTGRNLDLSENEGRIRVGKKLLTSTSTGTVSTLLNYPVGFKFVNDGTGSKWYTATGNGITGYVFQGTSAVSGAFARINITATGAPLNLDSSKTDIETAYGDLYVSAPDGKVYRYTSANTWSNFTAGSATLYASMLCYFPYQDRVYCSKDANQIQSWDSSDTVVSPGSQYALQLPAEDLITCMRPSNDRIWICTLHVRGGYGTVYEWDGSSTFFNKSYRLQTNGALSCIIKDDIPYIIDSVGNILAWNGGTFVKKAGLNRLSNKILYNSGSLTNNRFVHPNGMAIINERINVLIDGTYFDAADHTGTMDITIPSGIYEFDETRGLIHKNSFVVNNATDELRDYGQTRIMAAGGLTGSFSSAQAFVSTNGTFLAGANIFDSASSTQSCIAYDDNNDTIRKSFSFITPQIDSQGIYDKWQKLYLKFTSLPVGDKLVAKYRTIIDTPIEAAITWASPTVFTTTTNVSAYWTEGTGSEVEILQGLCSGQCSHITSIVENAGTYTVTLDESHVDATNGTGRARFSKWVKLNQTITSGNFKELPIGKQSTWIQFKIFGLVTGEVEIEEAQLINEINKPSA